MRNARSQMLLSHFKKGNFIQVGRILMSSTSIVHYTVMIIIITIRNLETLSNHLLWPHAWSQF